MFEAIRATWSNKQLPISLRVPVKDRYCHDYSLVVKTFSLALSVAWELNWKNYLCL